MLVTDMPIWVDCPFRRLVPKNIEIRRGLNEGKDFIVLWDPIAELHIDVPARSLETKKGRGRSLRRIIDSLAYFSRNKELLKT